MSEADCYSKAIGDGLDPSGTPWAQLDPTLLYTQRTSIKWRRYSDRVLPMFVAEMDFPVAPEIRHALVHAIQASDIGYVEHPEPLAEAFSGFARDRWGWQIAQQQVHLATDVATGIVEALRVGRPAGGRLVLPTPCYPGFFEMLQELPFEVVELPLTPDAALDLTAIQREFELGASAFILCNPHNPHGVPFSRAELTALAELAAQHDVFVVSDEIHAPLTHSGTTFNPFAPIAAAAGAVAVTTTSASKGWNIAGAKCAMIIAADERANKILATLPPEVHTRTSILGLHANIAAFTAGRDWLDRAVAQITRNQALLAQLLRSRLPQLHYRPGSAGYLAWLDLRATGLGENPAATILAQAQLALNDGRFFGAGGTGHARLNLACAPDTIVHATERLATLIEHHEGTHA